jgi:uncharacterized protein (DUF983 family)
MIVRPRPKQKVNPLTTTCPSCGESNLFDVSSGNPPATRCRKCDCCYTVNTDNGKPVYGTETVTYNNPYS